MPHLARQAVISGHAAFDEVSQQGQSFSAMPGIEVAMSFMAFMQSLIASSGAEAEGTDLCVSACIDAPAHPEVIGASGSATAIKIASMIRKCLRRSLLLVSQNAQCRGRVNVRLEHSIGASATRSSAWRGSLQDL
jgi:hypothetical protein